MIPHLLLLWCVGSTDPALLRSMACTQEQAFRIVDVGEAPERDGCTKAMERWLARKEDVVFALDAEILRVACEVPK